MWNKIHDHDSTPNACVTWLQISIEVNCSLLPKCERKIEKENGERKFSICNLAYNFIRLLYAIVCSVHGPEGLTKFYATGNRSVPYIGTEY